MTDSNRATYTALLSTTCLACGHIHPMLEPCRCQEVTGYTRGTLVTAIFAGVACGVAFGLLLAALFWSAPPMPEWLRQEWAPQYRLEDRR